MVNLYSGNIRESSSVFVSPGIFLPSPPSSCSSWLPSRKRTNFLMPLNFCFTLFLTENVRCGSLVKNVEHCRLLLLMILAFVSFPGILLPFFFFQLLNMLSCFAKSKGTDGERREIRLAFLCKLIIRQGNNDNFWRSFSAAVLFFSSLKLSRTTCGPFCARGVSFFLLNWICRTAGSCSF